MRWPGHRFALTFFSIVIAAWLLGMTVLMHKSALPSDASGTMLVVFEPGISSEQAFSAITSAGASPIRATAFDFIWVVNGSVPGVVGKLEQRGALGAYRELPLNPSIAGCMALAEAKITNQLGL
jgi:hypothetical protein